MNQKNSNPQSVAAVTQTLAGERMTITVNFPTTGDADCDFIQGILAVRNAIDNLWPGREELILRYMADRAKSNEDNTKQASQQDIGNLVRVHVQQYLREQALRQASLQPNQPWYGSISNTGSCPPGVIAGQTSASQIDSLGEMLNKMNLKP